MSLLWCVATLVLLVRSYWFRDVLRYEPSRQGPFRDGSAYYLGSELGTLSVIRDAEWLPANIPSLTGSFPTKLRLRHLKASRSTFEGHAQALNAHHLLGFRWGGISPPFESHYMVAVPDWFIFAVTGAAPVFWAYRRARRGRRARRHQCLSCGYNLSGNTSGVCPECGTLATQESATKST